MPVPSQPVPAARRHAPTAARERHARLRLLAWPLVALAFALALLAWRTDPGGTDAGRADGAGTAPLATRSVGDLRLRVPVGWHELERSGRERATWGEADRSHVVTLAATESSGEPLLAIVAAVARDARESMPGVQVVDGPTQVDPPGDLPYADAVVRLRLRAETDAGTVDVVQTWRRDSRAGTDVVATWTSTDGRWPADPADSIPEGS